MSEPNQQNEHWHLDKRVPIALIFVLMSQMVGFGYMLGDHSSRLTSVEKYQNDHRTVVERVAKMEIHLEHIRESLEHMLEYQQQLFLEKK